MSFEYYYRQHLEAKNFDAAMKAALTIKRSLYYKQPSYAGFNKVVNLVSSRVNSELMTTILERNLEIMEIHFDTLKDVIVVKARCIKSIGDEPCLA